LAFFLNLKFARSALYAAIFNTIEFGSRNQIPKKRKIIHEEKINRLIVKLE